MKLRYYFMSMLMIASASVGFTSCSDDDDPVPVVNDRNDLVLGIDARVKIGPDTRIELPIETGNGEYQAYSLDPEIADVVIGEDGKYYIEGFKNGKARIVVSDAANNYKQLVVGVYTTDNMKLNYTNLEVTALVGQSENVPGFEVTEGNGGYTATVNDNRVTMIINAEAGTMTIRATADETPYTAVVTVEDQTGLTATVNVSVAPATARVKIGTDTREQLPIDVNAGEYEITLVNGGQKAKLVSDASGEYIEGLANGTAVVKVCQGDTVRQITYSIYTTDVMRLNETSLSVTAPLGIAATVKDLKVLEGNGGYSVSSSNTAIAASINADGVVTLNVTAKVENYTAEITIKDQTGLSAKATVTVNATFDPFTDSELQDIQTLTKNTVWIQAANKFSQNINSDFTRYESDGEWTDEADGNSHTFGWWEIYYGSDYGGHYIIYPEGTGLNEEVDATYRFRYAAWGSSTYNLPGKAKILQDDDTKKVMIWWNVDMQNEVIQRGWIVKMK
ncbi:MAG: hypothetical protein NC111_02535 [Bacteroides sp.]|nr:hypothetical protein [Bacteroides sp.]MCM1413295.1 hypothetical protein [Bacteroides sp.]MCM1471395.1 hypothetical protein [Bacteroides sp.]